MSWGSIAKEGESPLPAAGLPESGLSFESVRKSQGPPVTGAGVVWSVLTKSSSREKLNQSEGFDSDIIGRGEKSGVEIEGEGSRELEVVELCVVNRSMLTKSDRSVGLGGTDDCCIRLPTNMM
jgi:hypothetical protein